MSGLHDLTKLRLDLLNDARKKLEGKEGWFCYADMKSNLKIRKANQFFKFNTTEQLDDILLKL